MDQNAMTSMDPKLREAYERVMGTTVAPKPPVAPAVQQPAPPPVQAAPPPPPAAPVNNQPVMQQPVMPPPPPMQSTPAPSQPAPAFQTQQPTQQPAANIGHTSTLASLDTTAATEMHAYVADEVASAKQNIKTIQLIYIAGGILFFAIYALFWMKFFEVASPF